MHKPPQKSSKRHRHQNHAHAIVIAHGKTEYQIAHFLKSELKIPLEIKKLDSSIQINALHRIFTGKDFSSEKNMICAFDQLEVDDDGHLQNTVIFPIMDLDDTDSTTIKSYLDGTLFTDMWLGDLVHPIFNRQNIEDVFENMGEGYTRNSKQKGKYYTAQFPINHSKYAGLEGVQRYAGKLEKCPLTNMEDLFNHCLLEAARKQCQ